MSNKQEHAGDFYPENGDKSFHSVKENFRCYHTNGKAKRFSSIPYNSDPPSGNTESADVALGISGGSCFNG